MRKKHIKILILSIGLVACIILIGVFKKECQIIKKSIWNKQNQLVEIRELAKQYIKGTGDIPKMSKDDYLEDIHAILQECHLQESLHQMRPIITGKKKDSMGLKISIELQDALPNNVLNYLYKIRHIKGMVLISLRMKKDEEDRGMDVSMVLGAIVKQ